MAAKGTRAKTTAAAGVGVGACGPVDFYGTSTGVILVLFILIAIIGTAGYTGPVY